MFGSFDFQEFLSAFIVLFAVIDIIGSIPIILNLKQKGRNVNANKATGISFALLIGFFYCRRYDAEVISGRYRFRLPWAGVFCYFFSCLWK